MVLVLIGIVVLISLYLINQKPLNTDGFSANNERSKVILGLVNDGNFDITIDEIQVNYKMPLSTQLVISYSSQLASSGGIYTDPLAKFLEIKSPKIHPELTAHEKREAYSLSTNTKPISYGLSITNDEKITTIEIKYKYLGIKHVKVVNLDKWFE